MFKVKTLWITDGKVHIMSRAQASSSVVARSWKLEEEEEEEMCRTRERCARLLCFPRPLQADQGGRTTRATMFLRLYLLQWSTLHIRMGVALGCTRILSMVAARRSMRQSSSHTKSFLIRTSVRSTQRLPTCQTSTRFCSINLCSLSYQSRSPFSGLPMLHTPITHTHIIDMDSTFSIFSHINIKFSSSSSSSNIISNISSNSNSSNGGGATFLLYQRCLSILCNMTKPARTR